MRFYANFSKKKLKKTTTKWLMTIPIQRNRRAPPSVITDMFYSRLVHWQPLAPAIAPQRRQMPTPHPRHASLTADLHAHPTLPLIFFFPNVSIVHPCWLIVGGEKGIPFFRLVGAGASESRPPTAGPGASLQGIPFNAQWRAGAFNLNCSEGTWSVQESKP